MIYLVGSLRNPAIPKIAETIRAEGHDVFDGWFSAGPEADDHWQAYADLRGQTFAEALADYPAQHVFNFDLTHLKKADTVVLVLPAGKSGHMELGWALGKGKRGYILLDGVPERYDVMYNFADGVFADIYDLLEAL